MTRTRTAIAVAAGVALLVVAPGANAAQAKKAPSLGPIEAVFLGTDVKATQYTASLTLVPGNLKPTFSWHLTPPADDPTCNNFRSLSSNHENPNMAIWHHADVSESPADGCHHKDPQHLGTVYVDVTVPFQGDQGRPWICHASYFGSLSGKGDDPGPGGCTIEAPAKHAVVSLGLTVKEQADIDIAYYQDCIDTYTAEAVGFGLGAAVPVVGPLSGTAGAVATATAWNCDRWKKQAEKRKKDPPDPNYLAVAPPARVSVPLVRLTSPALSAALNALTANGARSTAVNDALATAINRASTAARAKNASAKTLQLKAAGKDALQLASLETVRGGLRKALIAAARAAKLNTLTLTPAQFAHAVTQPLPKVVLDELSRLHAGSAGVADLRAALKNAKVPSAPVSLLAGLADGRVAAAEKKDAAALRAFAKSVGVH